MGFLRAREVGEPRDVEVERTVRLRAIRRYRHHLVTVPSLQRGNVCSRHPSSFNPKDGLAPFLEDEATHKKFHAPLNDS